MDDKDCVAVMEGIFPGDYFLCYVVELTYWAPQRVELKKVKNYEQRSMKYFLETTIVKAKRPFNNSLACFHNYYTFVTTLCFFFFFYFQMCAFISKERFSCLCSPLYIR
jgi:hypothetical protein